MMQSPGSRVTISYTVSFQRLQKRHIQIIKYNGYRQHSLLNESSTDNRDYKPKATAMAVLLISERITRESVMHMEREGGWH